VRLRHVCVAFSPDGKTLVSGRDVGAILWNVATGARPDWFRDRSPATAAIFSQDGKTLITADNTGSIRHWQVGTGKLLREHKQTQELGFGGGRRTFFSANGARLGIRGLFGHLSVRDVDTGELIFAKPWQGRFNLDSAALSPDGKALVFSDEANLIHFIHPAGGKEIRQLQGPKPSLDAGHHFTRMRAEFVSHFAFSPDAKLLTARTRRGLVAWDLQTGMLRYTIKDCFGRTVFSPDGKYLACAGESPVRLYEAASGKEIRRFEPHAGYIVALAFSPDATVLAAVQEYGLSLWDVASGKALHPIRGHQGPLASFAFSPDGRSLASGDSGRGTMIVWDVASRKPRHVFTGHYPSVLSLAYSPDGKTIASGEGYMGSGGLDAHIHIWDAAEGKLMRKWPAHLPGVYGLAFPPDGRILASAGGDNRARLWDPATGKRLLQMRSHTQLRSPAFSPDGKALLLVGTLSELALWRTDTGQKLRDLGDEDRRWVFAAAFLPGTNTVLAREGGHNLNFNGICFYDSATGRLLRSFRTGPDNPYQPAFALAPNGKLLATTNGYYRIELWDTVSERLVGRLTGQEAGVGALAFSPDSKTLASGGRDATILLWDVAQARLVHLWGELAAGQDEVGRALKQMALTSKDTLPFLKKRLLQVARTESRVQGLIADLGADEFKVRQKASRELEQLGADSALGLRLALRQPLDLEVRRRIEAVLNRVDRPGKTQTFDPRGIRLALAMFEEMNTAEARQVLRDLASAGQSTIARDAAAALARLAKKK
jgi:WD40 repeat protein